MKIIFRVMITVLFVFVSFVAQAQDNSELKKMIQKQAMSTCANQSFLACIGTTKTKCTSAAKKALASCDHLFPTNATSMLDSSMDAQRACLRKSLVKNIGITEDKLHKCNMNAQNGSGSDAAINGDNVAQFQ